MSKEEEKPKNFCYCGAPADYGYYDHFETPQGNYKQDTYYCNLHYKEYDKKDIQGKMQERDHISCKHEWKRRGLIDHG